MGAASTSIVAPAQSAALMPMPRSLGEKLEAVQHATAMGESALIMSGLPG